MEIHISNLQQIAQAARTFIRLMPGHTIFAFYGTMGAGKPDGAMDLMWPQPPWALMPQ